MEQKKHLPIFGVGPFYGAGIIGATVLGIVLTRTVLSGGAVTGAVTKWIFTGLGIICIFLGIAVWTPAALGKNNIDRYIQKNTLCTTGIYACVRNPCYSGIALACTGALLLARSWWLLILPPLFWLSMTVLMKYSEEKWLLELYGESYREYCRKVNRCIPWPPRK